MFILLIHIKIVSIYINFPFPLCMDIQAEILKEHSRQQALYIAAWVGQDPERMGLLLHAFLNGDYVVAQRASWILNLVYEQQPQLVAPHLEQITQRMVEDGVHVAVKRNVVRILQTAEIPEHLQGRVMDTCFHLLADPKETVAVRCFSMTVLDKLSLIYPELRQELEAILQAQLEQGASAGFRSRARKILGRK